jgi:hypothetical protein
VCTSGQAIVWSRAPGFPHQVGTRPSAASKKTQRKKTTMRPGNTQSDRRTPLNPASVDDITADIERFLKS